MFGRSNARYPTLLAALLLLMAVLTGTTGAAAVEACNGQAATIVGTAGNDTITGGPGDDVIVGKQGNDVIDGGGGNDTICGGIGSDMIDGGPGDDWLDGEAGTDWLTYLSAPAGVTVDLAAGTAFGGGGTDTVARFSKVTGSEFDDRLSGNAQENWLQGEGGDDRINGRKGDDLLMGGAGDDILRGRAGNDGLLGGPGVDTVSYVAAPAAVDVDLGPAGVGVANGEGRDSITEMENVRGSRHDDVIRGNPFDNVLIGFKGNDSLTGGGGNDTLRGKQGDDELSGSRGDDRLLGGAGTDNANGGSGIDFCKAESQANCEGALVSDIGFDRSTGTISLGVIASLTGPFAGIGQSVFDGHRVYWDALNAAGGVAGRYPVELVVRDDSSNPAITLDAFNQIEGEVLGLSSTFRIAATETLVDPAASADVLVAAGARLSDWAREPNVVLNLATPTYFAEFANGPYWAMELADPSVITDTTTVGIVYQDDAYGADCLGGYELAEANLGFDAAYVAAYQPGDTDFSGQIVGAQIHEVDVLFICAEPSALAAMVGTAAAVQYSPAIFASSASYHPALPAALGGGDEAAGVALFNSFPYHQLGLTTPWEADFPGVVAMRGAASAHGVAEEDVNEWFAFGYTQAATFHQIIETAVARRDITRIGLEEAFAKTTAVDIGFGRGTAGFGPTARDRIPGNVDLVGVVTRLEQRRFGLEPVLDYFEAPFLADWDPGG